MRSPHTFESQYDQRVGRLKSTEGSVMNTEHREEAARWLYMRLRVQTHAKKTPPTEESLKHKQITQ